MRAALQVLASTYRAARSLFPLSDAGSSGVVVYIDQLNAAGPADDLCTATGVGHVWLLVRRNDAEAVVQRLFFEHHMCLEPPPEAHRVLHIDASLLSKE